MGPGDHRGPHPADPADLGAAALGPLREAVSDVSWLIGRGYTEPAAIKLVGDRWGLTKRQRSAVLRCACTDEQRAARIAKRVAPSAAAIEIDAFNVVITLERGLSGGPVLFGRDGAPRDLGSVHGTWRAVQETPEALTWLGRVLVGPARFWIDAPVSNSGRLAAMIRGAAEANGWDWQAELVPRPDPVLAAMPIVATSDAWILDRCGAWCDLTGAALALAKPDAWRVELG